VPSGVLLFVGTGGRLVVAVPGRRVIRGRIRTRPIAGCERPSPVPGIMIEFASRTLRDYLWTAIPVNGERNSN